jgi:hypothetical protein
MKLRCGFMPPLFFDILLDEKQVPIGFLRNVLPFGVPKNAWLSFFATSRHPKGHPKGDILDIPQDIPQGTFYNPSVNIK